jgi:3-dehydroquinate dehydratase-2
MNIIIINGPNLNLLGKREKNIYGDQDFESFLTELQKEFESVKLEYFQSNVEGEIIDKIHEYGFNYHGIILNAGAYTHTSVAIRDAIAGVKTPVIEVHLSNVFARESFRHESMIAPKCIGSISGFGLSSYKLALQYLLEST